RVYIRKLVFEVPAEYAIDRALHQRAVTQLGVLQSLLVALVLNRAGNLLRNEGQDFLLPLSESNLFAVALHNQNAERGVPGLERNPQPIERRGANRFHLPA